MELDKKFYIKEAFLLISVNAKYSLFPQNPLISKLIGLE